MDITYTILVPVAGPHHLDVILVAGSELYLNIHGKHMYLLKSDIPNVIQRYGSHMIKRHEELFGTLTEDDSIMIGLSVSKFCYCSSD